MTSQEDRTPVLIGVGQAAERPTDPDYQALSPADLAGAAARAALADAGASGDLAASLDVIAAIRQFEISSPGARPPFGASNNFPRSVAKRIGADPARAILEITGGQGPQRLVGEFCEAISRGEARAVLLVGSEAMSTVLTLNARGETPDWSETVEGSLEDRGYGLEGMFTPSILKHRIAGAIPAYALFENARRARLGLDRPTYARRMGELFAPFTRVAAANPYSASPVEKTAEELVAVSDKNRIVADPFTRMLVARDQVNQAAAVILTSVGVARALGVPESKFVYLHGQGDANELTIMERPDLSASPSAIAAGRKALELAGRTVDDMAVFDCYSCFPLAVFNMIDVLGIAADDPRGLTLTGGLPYFGGAGNNYSMHAIAEAVPALRARPGAYGFVGANGGMLSKYSAGVYSTTPADWSRPEARRAKIPYDPVPGLEVDTATGEATVETYTTTTTRSGPAIVVIARLDNGGRVAANQASEAAFSELAAREPIGRRVRLETDAEGFNRFTFID
ncbi:MAG: acetyl-CoA acetyltransferase [Phenylobacterium sp.]